MGTSDVVNSKRKLYEKVETFLPPPFLIGDRDLTEPEREDAVPHKSPIVP